MTWPRDISGCAGVYMPGPAEGRIRRARLVASVAGFPAASIRLGTRAPEGVAVLVDVWPGTGTVRKYRGPVAPIGTILARRMGRAVLESLKRSHGR